MQPESWRRPNSNEQKEEKHEACCDQAGNLFKLVSLDRERDAIQPGQTQSRDRGQKPAALLWTIKRESAAI